MLELRLKSYRGQLEHVIRQPARHKRKARQLGSEDDQGKCHELASAS